MKWRSQNLQRTVLQFPSASSVSDGLFSFHELLHFVLLCCPWCDLRDVEPCEENNIELLRLTTVQPTNSSRTICQKLRVTPKFTYGNSSRAKCWVALSLVTLSSGNTLRFCDVGRLGYGQAFTRTLLRPFQRGTQFMHVFVVFVSAFM